MNNDTHTDVIAGKIGNIVIVLNAPGIGVTAGLVRARRASVVFGVPQIQAKSQPHGRKSSMTVQIPNDDLATVPLIFKDAAGHVMAGDTESNITVVVSDPTLATASLTTDGNWVVVTPLVASGSGSVTYTDPNDNLTASFNFNIVEPLPVSAVFNEAGAVFTSNPNPPSGAPGSTITGGASSVSGGASTTGASSTVSGAAATVSGAAAA
jgi:hypothetical protein